MPGRAVNREAAGDGAASRRGGVIFVQNEIDSRIVYGVLGVVLIVVIGFFVWRLRTPAFNPQTTGSEAYQRHLQQGGTFYQPPPGAPVPQPSRQ